MSYIPYTQRNKNVDKTALSTETATPEPKFEPASSTGYVSVFDRSTPEYKNSVLHKERYEKFKAEAEVAQEEARKAGSFGGIFKNTILGLPKAALNVGKDILQGTARSGGMVGLSLLGEDQLPDTAASRFFFGEKPLRSIQGAIQKTRTDLEELGVNAKATKALSPLLVVGSIGLDFFGGGGEKKGIEEIAQAIAKTKSVPEIISHLTPYAKNASEKDLEILGHSLKDVDNPAKVKTVLEAFSQKPREATPGTFGAGNPSDILGSKSYKRSKKGFDDYFSANYPKSETTPIRQVKVPVKDIELPETLQIRQAALEMKKDYIDNSPFRDLLKYVARKGEFKGELPEVGAGGKGKFATKGDTMLEGYHKDLDSEEVRAEMDKYIQDRKNYDAELKSFNEDKKSYIEGAKNERAIEKVGQQQARRTELDMEIAKREKENTLRLAERKKAFDEGVARAKAEAEAKSIRQEKIKQAFQFEPPEETGILKKLGDSLNPRRTLDKKTQGYYNAWTRGRNMAKELGQKEFGKIGVPEKEGLDTILNYQAGKETPYSAKIKEIFDSMFKEAHDRAGLDIGYRKNYLPQVYKETPSEIRAKILDYLTDNGLSYGEAQMYLEGKPLGDEFVKRLGLNPFFSKDRVFPNYKTAMEYGLTPKYSNPDQLAAYYRQNLEKTIVDKKFIDSLIEDAKILPVEAAPNSWKPVALPFSQKGYYAEGKLADFLNGVFDDARERGFTDMVFKVAADASRKAQEIALSAGIPKTNINFFSIGQLIKQMTAGDFKAISPFIRANFNKKSIQFFQDNHDIIQKMAGEGIDLGGRIGTYDNVYKNLAKEWKELPKDLRKKDTYSGFYNIAGDAFDKLFNEKTFASFMPQLNIQTFKSTYQKALARGLGDEEARKLAGDVTKKMFGLIEDVGRTGKTKDKLTAAFFAPKFRESIINTLANTGKAGIDFLKHFGGLKGKLDPALKNNRKLLGGMILTYAMYDTLNYSMNGHHIWQNPKGKEFALQIPSENGTLTYVEFMPSFLAFARNIGSGIIATGKGDFSTATQKFGSVLSMPFKMTFEILSNKDYFGNPIYKETDTGAQKAGKIAKYVGLQVNHPYIKETINQINDKKPLYQSLIAALELPLRFSSKEKVSQGEFYDALARKSKENARATERVRETYDEVQSLVAEGKQTEAQALVDGLSDEDYAVYKKIRTSDKRRLTISNEAKLFTLAKEVDKLLKEGKREEAQKLIDALTDDEYHAYKLVKEKI